MLIIVFLFTGMSKNIFPSSGWPLYRFICMPNGYKDGPRLFTKVPKVPFALLRSRGHESVIYLDDGYLQGLTYALCLTNIQDTVSLLTSLGFFISPKSVLQPTQELTYLGFVLNSVSMSITLTEKRKDKLWSLTDSLLAQPTQSIRKVAGLIGTIIAALPGGLHGQLHYRRLERDKNRALSHACGNYNKHMTLSPQALTDIGWWHAHVLSASSFIRAPEYSISLYTDASLDGWGATDSHSTVGGAWDPDAPPAHINVLELMALPSLCATARDVHIRICMDNSTAVSYVNKMGGSQSADCDGLAVELWSWAVPRNVWLSAVFIPGKDNLVADYYSRYTKENTEWQLNPGIFDKLCQVLLSPTIDLFASPYNHHLPVYVSWHFDPSAYATDAFSLTWTNFLFYAFPPSLLLAW